MPNQQRRHLAVCPVRNHMRGAERGRAVYMSDFTQKPYSMKFELAPIGRHHFPVEQLGLAGDEPLGTMNIRLTIKMLKDFTRYP
jgi:hypothetical protein